MACGSRRTDLKDGKIIGRILEGKAYHRKLKCGWPVARHCENVEEIIRVPDFAVVQDVVRGAGLSGPTVRRQRLLETAAVC